MGSILGIVPQFTAGTSPRSCKKAVCIIEVDVLMHGWYTASAPIEPKIIAPKIIGHRKEQTLKIKSKRRD